MAINLEYTWIVAGIVSYNIVAFLDSATFLSGAYKGPTTLDFLKSFVYIQLGIYGVYGTVIAKV